MSWKIATPLTLLTNHLSLAITSFEEGVAWIFKVFVNSAKSEACSDFIADIKKSRLQSQENFSRVYSDFIAEIKETCLQSWEISAKKAKSILIPLQKSRKVLQEHNPFTSQESWKLCKKGSLLSFYRRYQEKLILEWRRLCKSLFWFYCRNQEKNVSRAYFVSISGVEKTLQSEVYSDFIAEIKKTVSRVEKTLQDFRVNILEKTVDLVHFEVSQRFYI